METEGCDTLKELMSFVDRHDVEISTIKSNIDRVNAIAMSTEYDVNKLKTIEPDINRKLNDVQVKHNRLERHAVDHWGYRF
jgi:uncharacterized protein (UPF0335 family)